MIALPDGFNVGDVVTAFATLGTYIVGAYCIVIAANHVIRAIRGFK